ncbi:MAG: mandelate racemase [Burkholderiales bacterium]|nr:mandelate racemase [Burkholderiales bacterium]
MTAASGTEALTIREVRTVPVLAPLAKPVRTASGAILQAPLVLIDLITDEGVTGHAYVFAYQTSALKALDELVRGVGATLAGEAAVPFEVERTLRSRFTLLGGPRNLAAFALAGLDMAVWDALAVARGVPLVELLGGRRKELPVYASFGLLGPQEAAAECAAAAAAGFPGVKIKLGWPTLAEDLAAVRAARQALPEPAALMVDFNQSLGLAEAARRCRALEDEGVYWIEEPVRCDDFAGHAALARMLDVPVQIGENFAGPFEMQRALEARACDFVMPDVQQIGGVTGWMRAAAVAQAYGCDCSSHIFVEASAHLLAVTPTAHFLEHLDLAGRLLEAPLTVERGKAEAPARPGIGLAWDRAAVERWRVH